MVDSGCLAAKKALFGLYKRLGEFVETSKMYHKILCNDPDNAEIRMEYANMMKAVGKSEEAEKFLNSFGQNENYGKGNEGRFGEGAVSIKWDMPSPLSKANVKWAVFENISLDDLMVAERFQVQGKGTFLQPKRITDSVAYSFLHGDEKVFLEYNRQFGAPDGFVDRFNSLLKSIKENGYPFNDKYICVYKDESIVRDGRHRAAILRYLWGNRIIPVVRFTVRGKLQSWILPGNEGAIPWAEVPGDQ